MSSLERRESAGALRSATYAVAAFVLASMVLTWPLALQLDRALPGTYREPLIAAWAMAWVNGTIAQGDFGEIWNANIFFPETGSLAFSHHFIGQALLVAPVQWISDSPLLAYNSAFLLTFILTGLGVFLLARSLTGSDAGGYAAGFIAAFNQSRLTSAVSDLAGLSIFALPFALYALHRYFRTDRRRYLVLTVAAATALHLSSVEHLGYAVPIAFVFVVVECIRLRRLRTLRVWLELWATAAAVVASTIPFVLPMLASRQRVGAEGSLRALFELSDPFRWMMTVVFALALLVAVVVAVLERRSRIGGRLVAAAAAAVFVGSSQPGDFPLNGAVETELMSPASYLTPLSELPAIYDAVDSLRPGAILVELPFGDEAYEFRYMYFASLHRRRLLNGFGEVLPPSFIARQRVLARPLLDPPASWQAISAATHVVVHRSAWKDDTGAKVVAWLEAFGGRRIAGADGALLIELPTRENFAAHPRERSYPPHQP